MGLTGPDAGPGGGYLVIGPGDDPARYAGSDRVVVQSETVNIFIAFRILSTDPAVMAGAKAALKMSRLGQDPAPRYARPYWDGTRWYKSFDFDISQETGTVLQLDQRATWFYEAVTSSEGMIHPRPGAGQVYMTSKRDSRGRLVRADRSYRLHVPPGVPVAQF